MKRGDPTVTVGAVESAGAGVEVSIVVVVVRVSVETSRMLSNLRSAGRVFANGCLERKRKEVCVWAYCGEPRRACGEAIEYERVVARVDAPRVP
jgi:hypothetical protein